MQKTNAIRKGLSYTHLQRKREANLFAAMDVLYNIVYFTYVEWISSAASLRHIECRNEAIPAMNLESDLWDMVYFFLLFLFLMC